MLHKNGNNNPNKQKQKLSFPLKEENNWNLPGNEWFYFMDKIPTRKDPLEFNFLSIPFGS